MLPKALSVSDIVLVSVNVERFRDNDKENAREGAPWTTWGLQFGLESIIQLRSVRRGPVMVLKVPGMN